MKVNSEAKLIQIKYKLNFLLIVKIHNFSLLNQIYLNHQFFNKNLIKQIQSKYKRKQKRLYYITNKVKQNKYNNNLKILAKMNPLVQYKKIANKIKVSNKKQKMIIRMIQVLTHLLLVIIMLRNNTNLCSIQNLMNKQKTVKALMNRVKVMNLMNLKNLVNLKNPNNNIKFIIIFNFWSLIIIEVFIYK